MRARLLTFFAYALLGTWLVLVVAPLLWVLLSSLRGSQEFVTNPFGVPWLLQGAPESALTTGGDPVDPAAVVVSNYRRAWVDSQFGAFFLNSVLVTVCAMGGILLLGSMAAYALARFQFRGNRLLYIYFISGMMVPAQLLLIPLFFQFTTLSEWGSALLSPLGLAVQLHDSLSGLVMLYIALSLPFTVLVLTGFFRTLPGELREAGIIDGCGEYRVFWHVMLPLARPGLVSVGIFNFIGLWNEYLFALVFLTSDEKKTLPLGLASVSMQSQYQTDFGLLFAALVIVLIPTLAIYVLLQGQLTRGITLGALKG